MRRIRQNDEVQKRIQNFLDNILAQKSSYYTDSSLHVSSVAHPCALNSYFTLTKKEESNPRAQDPSLRDWYLKIGSLLHAGLEKQITEYSTDTTIEVEKVVRYDLTRDCIADEQSKEEDVLKGRIDLIINDEDGCIVVDWKTTRKSKGIGYAYNPSYINQLTTYAYILTKMNYRIKQLALVFFNLVSDEIMVMTFEYDENEAKKHLQTIKAVHKALKENRAPEKNVGNWCFFCPFRKTCMGT